MVKLIYFLPSDREPQPDIDEKMDRLIRDVQQFYAVQMKIHGFGRKTFLFETDARGKAVVHRVIGRFTDKHYTDLPNTWDIWGEIENQFDMSRNYYLTAIDISSELLDGGSACGIGGVWSSAAGKVLIPASGSCFKVNVAAHELGHAFGLQHDFRSDAYIMSYGAVRNRISKCTAEWLNVHRAFNTGNPPLYLDKVTTIKMLPPGLKSPPNFISFTFEVSDLDGLHQVQLLTPTLTGPAQGYNELLSCKTLYGNTSTTVEFVTAELTPKNSTIFLQLIDVHGNLTWRTFPIAVTPLLSPPEVVSIPDPNLAAAVRESLQESIDLAPGDALTTHTMPYLFQLDARNRQITDLTGLEYAYNLIFLDIGGEYIDGQGFVNNNAVSDFSPLEGLTQLTWLDYSNSSLSNVPPLAALTQLTNLDLSGNSISDVSSLAPLTQLTDLNLSHNSISDVSSLAPLIQLRHLYLWNNNISDASSLAPLTQLTDLNLSHNSISDVSSLAPLIQLRHLYLWNNNISNVASLAPLTQLTKLNLGGNSISDVSALAALTQLIDLELGSNNISDVLPLSALTQLTDLDLGDNSISDVSPLSALVQLTNLDLSGNNVSDVSPLAALIQLRHLYLWNNNISNVAPLVGLNLTGTEWRSTGLTLQNNPLSYASIHIHIPAMQAKGFGVEFDNVAHPALLKISGDSQEDFAGKTLAAPFIVEAQDEHGQPMPGVTVTFAIEAGEGELNPTTTKTDADGKTQTTLTLGWTPGKSIIRTTVTDMKSYVQFTATATVLPDRLAVDVNADGVVGVDDLVFVASSFGAAPVPGALPDTDVNDDGKIDNEDLALVLAALEGTTAAPSLAPQWTAADLQRWIAEAKRRNISDATFQRGIAVLEQCLANLLPKETLLLANYPNPFNPETWIPYQLAKPAKVTLTLYEINGTLVRTIALGYQVAGHYHNRSRAAYWDGRNVLGEKVASGLYFYTLTADEFTATRKMLIRK